MKRLRMGALVLLLAAIGFRFWGLHKGSQNGTASNPARIPGGAEAEKIVIEKASVIPAEALARLDKKALAQAARIWGFLKYHHPAFARGELDADLEWVRLLEQLGAAEASAANSVFLRWVEGLGPTLPNSKAAKIPADAPLRPDLAWTGDTNQFGVELCAALAGAHAGRANGDHAYVRFVPGVGNPIFDSERAYKGLLPPPAALRLLCLARFWNIIEYYFPYRDIIGADWFPVLIEMTPKFLEADTPQKYELAAIELMARVNDSHCNLWGNLAQRPPIGKCGLDAQIRFVENRAVVCSIAETNTTVAGLKVGDVILAIDGEPVAELVRRWTPWYADSNEAARLRDIGNYLLKGPCGPFNVTVERDGASRGLELQRHEMNQRTLRRRQFDRGDPAFHLLSPEVAYLSLAYVRSAEVDSYLAQAKGTRGLVIDIRNYPQEFVVFDLGQRLVDRKQPFVRFTTAAPDNPGAFAWTPPISLRPDSPHYQGRIVILVDETSQSQAEYTAMAFRTAPGALVVGSTTAGADGNVSNIPLPGGLKPMISGIGVFYPDKRPTQRIGIIPDIESRPTLRGIRAGRDEVLERGLQEIVGAAAAQKIVEGARR